MARFIALLFLALQCAVFPQSAAAQELPGTRTVVSERWVEEWNPTTNSWDRVADSADTSIALADPITTITTRIVNGVVVEQTTNTQNVAQNAVRFAVPPVFQKPRVAVRPAPIPAGVQYGPFRVIDGKRAAIVGPTNRMSPQYFEAMLRDNPGLEVLEMIEAPGTSHDIANLQVGRAIRSAGLRTHVPNGGSVRSGAVELFLAGTTRTMDDHAEFAVHSWRDNYGREPQDFADDHPANRLYLDYYKEMGMSDSKARQFYAMTNSVPHVQALWLGADEMRPWARPERVLAPARRMYAEHPVIKREPRAILGLVEKREFPRLDLSTRVDVVGVELPTTELPSIEYADLSGAQEPLTKIALLDSAPAFP